MGLQENREQYFSSAQDQQWYGLLFLSDRSALMIDYYILTEPRLMVEKHQYREPVRSTLLSNLFGKGC